MRSLLLSALFSLTLFADAHILVYHRFDDVRHPDTSTTTASLLAQFEYLKTHGYKVVPLSTIYHALANDLAIDNKWVALTIDDSYESFYTQALPLFRRYGYPFSLFVYVEAADKGYGDFMSWDEIRDASKDGEIGLHGYGHRHLCHLAPYMVRDDTDRAIRSFQKELKTVPQYYAYPFGEYNDIVKAIIGEYGFRLVLNQTSGAINSQSDPLDLDRIAMTGENDLEAKLRIERLDVTWLSPSAWPEGGRLKEIHAKISTKYTSAMYYITGHGWKNTPVKNGVVSLPLDVELTAPRSRVFLKVGHKQHGKLLVKE